MEFSCVRYLCVRGFRLPQVLYRSTHTGTMNPQTRVRYLTVRVPTVLSPSFCYLGVIAPSSAAQNVCTYL